MGVGVGDGTRVGDEVGVMVALGVDEPQAVNPKLVAANKVKIKRNLVREGMVEIIFFLSIEDGCILSDIRFLRLISPHWIIQTG